MTVTSALKKISEITKLLYYIETGPFYFTLFSPDEQSENRKDLIDKYRNNLTDNPYFNKIIEPLVLRLYDHAEKSKHCKRYPCSYKGTTFAYTVRDHAIHPILTMGSKEQLQKICKKECPICPSEVYTPVILLGFIQLGMFETARLISRTKDKIKSLYSEV